jgi:CBS domain-containing protein
MGSEGRGEQTVRTDQDNGLIRAEPVDRHLLDTFRHDFTAAFESFRFAPCPGDVIVRNLVCAVAGNAQLLTEAKSAVMEAVRGRSAFMVHPGPSHASDANRLLQQAADAGWKR